MKWYTLNFIGMGCFSIVFLVLVELQAGGKFPLEVINGLHSPLDVCGWCKHRFDIGQTYDGRSGEAYATLLIPFFVSTVVLALAHLAMYHRLEKICCERGQARKRELPGPIWQALTRILFSLIIVLLVSPMELEHGRIGMFAFLVAPLLPFSLSAVVAVVSSDVAQVCTQLS